MITIIVMGMQNCHLAVISKYVRNKATTIYTSGFKAEQVNTGWLFPFQ
jgi:hypothetical protein